MTIFTRSGRHIRGAGRLGRLTLGTALVATAFAAVPSTSAQAAEDEWSQCVSGDSDRQATFERAARTSGVPTDVLLALSYLESRWDDHGDRPSTSGGYGPMHLTEPIDERTDGKGDPATPARPAPDIADTLSEAADITGIDVDTLRSDPVANICGGAALLADLQADAGGAASQGDWSAGIAAYSGASDRVSATRFVDQVFDTLRTGQARTTNDGHDVRLASQPGAKVDRQAIGELGLAAPETTSAGQADCPDSLGCEWIPAPYEWYDQSSTGGYGNHDLADRPNTMDIDYIVIHDTETPYEPTLGLVTDPTYVSWQYTLRSSDGHIANHLDNADVGWHAGNWYVNSHSIGLEHEGYAADGAWYTEAMYQTSSTLVRHLAKKYDVPLDRAHIIGHDQVPGILPNYVAGMHWDPGPYWDWEHYMDLLGSPIKPDRHGRSDVVTVRPGFEGNEQELVGCVEPGVPCEAQGTNLVYLHQEPSEDAPLVVDKGLRPNSSASTTQVSDIGARAAAGHKFLVAERRGDWLGVWYLGEIGWIHSPKSDPVVVPSQGQVVVPKGDEEVPVYGRAYPERAAYEPYEIPYQQVAPLQYTIKPGQAYVVADTDIETDYYYAKSFDCAHLADDCTQVVGEDEYYLIWIGHRMMYVRAADVELKDGVA